MLRIIIHVGCSYTSSCHFPTKVLWTFTTLAILKTQRQTLKFMYSIIIMTSIYAFLYQSQITASYFNNSELSVKFIYDLFGMCWEMWPVSASGDHVLVIKLLTSHTKPCCAKARLVLEFILLSLCFYQQGELHLIPSSVTGFILHQVYSHGSCHWQLCFKDKRTPSLTQPELKPMTSGPGHVQNMGPKNTPRFILAYPLTEHAMRVPL